MSESCVPVVYCDNTSALHLLQPYFSWKHVKIDYHFVREQVALKKLEIRHIPTDQQLANIFTKPLTANKFSVLSLKLGICSLLQLEGG